VIPSSLLLNELQQKLSLALDGFSQAGKELKLDLPQFVSIPSDSLFGRLGLKELTWGRDGFQFQMEPQTDTLLFEILPVFLGR
ncbi:MAG: hypothetical protein U1D33_00755, partial [bacterium]|nr:hypothetical protein [bacterium]